MIWRGLTKDDKQWTYIMLRGEKGKVKYTDIPEDLELLNSHYIHAVRVS